MHQVQQRIDALGGSSFVRDYHTHWEAWLFEAGLRLNYRSIPFYLAIDPIPCSADQAAVYWLPNLVTALGKSLAYCLTHSEQRRRLFSSLRNRQELLLLDIGRLPRISDMFGRFDTFLRYNGRAHMPTIIEANFNNVEGLYYQHLVQQAGYDFLTALGMPNAVRLPSVLWQFWRWMLRRYQASRPSPPTPTIGIIWEPGHVVKDIELPLAAECLRRWGHNEDVQVVTADWRSAAYSSRHGWTIDGQRVQIIWKNVGPYYPDDICETDYRYLSAAAPEEVCVLSDILGRLMGSKWLLEMLWNPRLRFLFTPREWQAIRRMVPWTVEVRDGVSEGPQGEKIPDLPRWLCRNRTKLVLKPVLGSHGEGVHLGLEVEQDSWNNTVHKAAGSGGWVAMLYVQPGQVDLPLVAGERQNSETSQTFFTDCNYYVLGGWPAGVIRRVAQDRLLNIARENNGQSSGGMIMAAHTVAGG